MKYSAFPLIAALALAAPLAASPAEAQQPATVVPGEERERRLANLRTGGS